MGSVAIATGPALLSARQGLPAIWFHGSVDVLPLLRHRNGLCESLAMGYTGMSALTDYPPSLKRAVPFKVHGANELAIAAALPAMPWVLGFADNKAARNLCFGLAAMTLLVAALTDWDSDEAD